jgi:hypothetical protein
MKETKLNRKALKSLPNRKEDISTYRQIYLVPSGLKHESGWMSVCIVGRRSDGELEVCAYPDDVNWDTTELRQKYDCTGMRTDCSYPEGVLHFWGNNVSFTVMESFSSTVIKVINRS